MSKTPYTPGPWKVSQCFKVVETAERYHPIGTPIVQLNPCGSIAHEESEANCRLIASAPDLVEALRELTAQTASCNARQHAGLEVMPEDWAALYQATNTAHAALEKAGCL